MGARGGGAGGAQPLGSVCRKPLALGPTPNLLKPSADAQTTTKCIKTRPALPSPGPDKKPRILRGIKNFADTSIVGISAGSLRGFFFKYFGL